MFQRASLGIKAGSQVDFFRQDFGFLINELIVSTTSFWAFCVCVTLITVIYVIRLGRRYIPQEGTLAHLSRLLVNSLL